MNQSEQKEETVVWLKPGEVAQRLGVSYQTVRRLIIDGRLPALQSVKHYRVSEAVLNAYIEARKTR